jgi:hypothetical protein
LTRGSAALAAWSSPRTRDQRPPRAKIHPWWHDARERGSGRIVLAAHTGPAAASRQDSPVVAPRKLARSAPVASTVSLALSDSAWRDLGTLCAMRQQWFPLARLRKRPSRAPALPPPTLGDLGDLRFTLEISGTLGTLLRPKRATLDDHGHRAAARQGHVGGEGESVRISLAPRSHPSVSSHPLEDSWLSSHPLEDSWLSSHPLEDSWLSSHPLEDSWLSSHPLEDSWLSSHPLEDSWLSSHPLEDSWLSSHPLEDSWLPRVAGLVSPG